MARTYYLTNTASDLTGGADFSNVLSTSTAVPGTISLNIAGGATEDSYGFTAAGEPGTSGTSTGTFSVEVDVTAGSTAVTMDILIARVNASGVVQSGPVAVNTGIALGTTGVKTASVTNPALGTWSAGDRLRVTYRFKSSSAHGNDSVTIEANSINCEVTTPFSAPAQNFTVNQPDALGLTDSATPVLTRAYSVDRQDALGLTDSATLNKATALDVSDSAGLVDVGDSDDTKVKKPHSQRRIITVSVG